MLGFFLRRIQRFILPLKVVGLLGSLGALGYLVIKVPPELGVLVFFSLILFVFLALVFSFFLAASPSLLAATSISFLLFLRATGLLTILNLALFAAFLVLLALYLRKK